MSEVRIATRRSRLAIAQAEIVAAMLVALDPDISVRLVEVETKGDLDRIGAIATLVETGAFVREVQQAVLDDRADLAVHSLKDLPVDGHPMLQIAAYPQRSAPHDVMVGNTLEGLPDGAMVGTGSPRRKAQIALHRPDLVTCELRGNVDTRLQKIEAGEVDAAVLAEAGLLRLGRGDAITQQLSVEAMVPAPGQGALAVEALPGTEPSELAAAIEVKRLRPLLEAERALLAETGAGCRSSLGALASWDGEQMRMDVFVADERGSRRAAVTGDDGAAVVADARMELGL